MKQNILPMNSKLSKSPPPRARCEVSDSYKGIGPTYFLLPDHISFIKFPTHVRQKIVGV